MTDVFDVLAGAASAAAAITGVAGFGPIIGDSAAPFALISSPSRNIGGIFPDVTVEEVHHDEMMITQHPVEAGAPITDHAFLQPYSVEIHAMWSNSSAQSEGYVQDVYDQLQALQQSAQPFSVVTGKRDYGNMLIRSLVVTTDAEREFALDVRATCQNIIITSSSTAAGGASSSPSSPSDGSGVVATVDPTTGVSTMDASPSSAYTLPAGATTPDANGNSSWSSSPFSGGTISLQAAPAGTPSAADATFSAPTTRSL